MALLYPCLRFGKHYPKIGLKSVIFAFEIWSVIVSSEGTPGLLTRIIRLLGRMRKYKLKPNPPR